MTNKDPKKVIYKFMICCVNTHIKICKMKKFIAEMSTYIHKCPIDNELKQKKLDKLMSLSNRLTNIKNIKHNVRLLACLWLELCCKQIVMQNGFFSIHKTLRYLGLNIEMDTTIDLNTELQTHVVRHYDSFIKHNFTPFNCDIIERQNMNKIIKCFRIRPALIELEGKLYGICIEIDQPNYTARFMGLLDADNLRVHRSLLPKREIFDDLNQRYKISQKEAEPYLNCLSFRDFLELETRQITNKIKQLKEKFDFYKTTNLTVLLSEYQFLNEYFRIEMISLLLEVGLRNQANYLYQIIPIPLKYLDWELQKKIFTSISFGFDATNNKEEDVPYETKIDNLNTSEKNKSKAYEKLKTITQSGDGDSKSQKYLDAFLKIPFGIYKSEDELEDPGKKLVKELYDKFPTFKNKKILSRLGNNYVKILEKAVTYKQSKEFCTIGLKKLLSAREKQKSYLNKVEEILQNCVHGHDLVKIQIRRLLAQWISGGQSGMVLGLEGPPGNGKTTLIKEGLSNCLIDSDGQKRPVGFIPLGGMTNGSSLIGHGFTYQGSTWGRIVDILMQSKCMNPIFLFDELDKVSNTEHGREIFSILTHLTDSTQNDEFYDKYFDGVELDLSKCIMIFTFNDRSKIDPILLDRMTVIQTNPLSTDDKLVVCKNHLIPQLCKLVDIEPKQVEIEDEDIENLIYDYTFEAGARQLKRLLQSLIQELNLQRLLNPNTKLIIDRFLIHDVFRHRDKIRKESVTDNEIVGQINGMYANSLGIGGILPIQVSKNVTETKLELTGTQGDVMKESMKCARNVAFMLKSRDDDSFNPTDTSYGLHIHCPSTSTPKDGPSAGGAICMAVYSFLSGKPILQNVAMTGELDLIGNITAIGGLDAKLTGAKRAGIKIALIPEENLQQLERMRDENKSPEDDSFHVYPVNHINQVLEFVFCD